MIWSLSQWAPISKFTSLSRNSVLWKFKTIRFAAAISYPCSGRAGRGCARQYATCTLDWFSQLAFSLCVYEFCWGMKGFFFVLSQVQSTKLVFLLKKFRWTTSFGAKWQFWVSKCFASFLVCLNSYKQRSRGESFWTWKFAGQDSPLSQLSIQNNRDIFVNCRRWVKKKSHKQSVNNHLPLFQWINDEFILAAFVQRKVIVMNDSKNETPKTLRLLVSESVIQ